MLWQLDAGSDEKLMLVSRDEQSCLVVSYREIKRCVEAAFRWAYQLYRTALSDRDGFTVNWYLCHEV
jgi:hypothetical protein